MNKKVDEMVCKISKFKKIQVNVENGGLACSFFINGKITITKIEIGVIAIRCNDFAIVEVYGKLKRMKFKYIGETRGFASFAFSDNTRVDMLGFN